MLRRMPAGVTPDFTTAALSVISLAARAVPTKRRGRSKRVLVVQAYAPQKCLPACVAVLRKYSIPLGLAVTTGSGRSPWHHECMVSLLKIASLLVENDG